MNAQQSYGLSSKVRDMWGRNQDLLRNAGSLAATTGMTSIFGFVFTIVAARMFTPDEVGWGNATINAMQVFTQAYVMTQGGPLNATMTVVLLLYRSAFVNLQFGYGAAIGVVLLLLLVGLSFLNKKISDWMGG